MIILKQCFQALSHLILKKPDEADTFITFFYKTKKTSFEKLGNLTKAQS